MTSLRERGTSKGLLVLLFSLILLKGWVMLNLIGGDAPVGVETASAQAPAPSKDKRTSLTEEADCCPEYLSGLIDKLQKENDWLRKRARMMEEDTRRMELYKKELEAKIEELARSRTDLQKMYEKVDKDEKNKETKLIKIYSSMEPDSAATRIEAMDEDIATWLLVQMNPRQSGAILGAMNPGKASRLSQRLSKKDGVMEDPPAPAPVTPIPPAAPSPATPPAPETVP